MGDHGYYILDTKRLEPAASARTWLGRIVKEYEAPGALFTPPDPSKFTKLGIKINTIQDAEQVVNASANKSLRVTLSEVASISSQNKHETSLEFQTSRLVSVRLENYPKIFKEMRMDSAIRGDLKEMLPMVGRPAYMIVGLLIWTDARFEETLSLGSHSGVSGKLAPGTIVGAATTSMPNKLGNAEASAETDLTLDVISRGFSPGSSIFAFEYKTVRRSPTSIIGGFKPVLASHGPRVKGDKVFSGDHQEQEKTVNEEDENISFELDELDTMWTDFLGDEERPDEEEVAGMIFIFRDLHNA